MCRQPGSDFAHHALELEVAQRSSTGGIDDGGLVAVLRGARKDEFGERDFGDLDVWKLRSNDALGAWSCFDSHEFASLLQQDAPRISLAQGDFTVSRELSLTAGG